MKSLIFLVTVMLFELCISAFNVSYAQQITREVMQTKGGYYLPVNIRHDDTVPNYVAFKEFNSLLSTPACHLALDYSTAVGTNVYAVADGYVERVSLTSGGYGGFRPRRPGGVAFIRHNMAEDGVMYGLYGHLQNLNIKAGDTVVAGQLIAEVGEFVDGREYFDKVLGGNVNLSDQFLPHLHFGLTSILPISADSYDGYTDDAKCDDLFGYVDPEIAMDRVDNYPVGHEWHGSGSLIKPKGNCPGCDEDFVILHSNNDKPFGVFQWKSEIGFCEAVEISAKSKSGQTVFFDTPIESLQVSVMAGDWENRDLDKYYVAKLPTIINVPEDNFNLIAIKIPVTLSELSSKYPSLNLSNGIQLTGKCLADRKLAADDNSKELISNTFRTILSDNSTVWSGSASLIQTEQVSSEVTLGVSKDIVHLRSQERTRNPYSTLQWVSKNSNCDKFNLSLLRGDQSEYFAQGVKGQVKIRKWDDPPSSSSTYNITFPWTSSFISTPGQFYLVSVKLDQRLPIELLALNIKAECQ